MQERYTASRSNEDGQEGRQGVRRAASQNSRVQPHGDAQAAIFDKVANTEEMLEEAMASLKSARVMSSKQRGELAGQDAGGPPPRISAESLSAQASLEQALRKAEMAASVFPCGCRNLSGLNAKSKKPLFGRIVRRRSCEGFGESPRLHGRRTSFLRVSLLHSGLERALESSLARGADG